MIRRILLCAAVGVLLPPALAAQSGAFVVRLGNDTVALEQYTLTADRLQGEQVVRTPRTQHRIYTATLGPTGAVQRFELAMHNVSDPKPTEQKATIEFRGDSAIATTEGGDSTVTRRIKLRAGAAPYLGQSAAFLELLTRRARGAGGALYTTAVLPIGSAESWDVAVNRLGRDSMTITLGPIGPLRMRVDDRGTLLGLSGIGSTMQVTVERVPSLDLATLGRAFAARPLGALSPADSVKTTIAGAALAVRYSRPSMRGRVIFGSVVPWNRVWRTGANAATTLETSADLIMGGATIPAGQYSLWTIPAPSGWTLIVNRNTGQWGTEYDEKYDLARLEMKVERPAQPVEQFTIAIEPRDPGGVLKLEWERTRAWIPFSGKP